MIELKLKAEPVGIGIHRYRRKAGIALRSYRNVIEALPVNDHIACIVLFGYRIREHGIPVVFIHDDVDADDLRCIEKLLLVLHVDGRSAEYRHKRIVESCKKKAQHYCSCHQCKYDLRCVFIIDHRSVLRTCSLRYKLPGLNRIHPQYHLCG